MEPSIACEVVKTINDSDLGVKVGTLIGDEDAAIIKAVHEEVDADVENGLMCLTSRGALAMLSSTSRAALAMLSSTSRANTRSCQTASLVM